MCVVVPPNTMPRESSSGPSVCRSSSGCIWIRCARCVCGSTPPGTTILPAASSTRAASLNVPGAVTAAIMPSCTAMSQAPAPCGVTTRPLRISRSSIARLLIPATVARALSWGCERIRSRRAFRAGCRAHEAARSDLQQVANGCDDELEHPGADAAVAPLLERDRSRLTNIGREDVFEPLGELAIVHDDVELFVHGERAVVEVGAADGGPRAVDDDGLGVEQGGAVLVHLGATLEQRAPGGAARLPHQRVVDRPGHQDLDGDTAAETVDDGRGHPL